MNWKQATLIAIQTHTAEMGSRQFSRQQLLVSKLDWIVAQVQAEGQTPSQTLSRVLQELRDDRILHFVNNAGVYWLLDSPIEATEADLPDETLDFALEQNKLAFTEDVAVVATADVVRQVRQRRGQARLRQLTLQNYGHCCAVCAVQEASLLVTSHIVRWQDDPVCRGELRNVLCLCAFHDVLFEQGYFGLTADYEVVRRAARYAPTVEWLLNTAVFKPPRQHPPSAQYLQRHRQRTTLE